MYTLIPAPAKLKSCGLDQKVWKIFVALKARDRLGNQLASIRGIFGGIENRGQILRRIFSALWFNLTPLGPTNFPNFPNFPNDSNDSHAMPR
jgi:hypothetical protein